MYNDANNLYVWAKCESLTYDETETCHAHPDPYLNKIEEILNTPDGSDSGYFVEIELT